MIGHTFPYAIRIPERPHSELVQDSDLLKDVELAKLLGFLFVAVRVEMRSLGLVLASGILVPDVVAELRLVLQRWSAVDDILETSMRGDPLEQGQADLLQFFGVARLQAFGLKVLHASN